MSEWNKERAAKLWAEGLSTIEIGERCGVGKNVICGHAKRNRAEFPERGNPGGKRPKQWDRQKADALTAAGMSLRETSASVGVNRSTLCKHLEKKQHGAKLRPRLGAAEVTRARERSARMMWPTPVIPKCRAPAPTIFVNTRRTCLFPMWDDTERPTHVYCDAPTNSSYCAEHHALCLTTWRWREAA